MTAPVCVGPQFRVGANVLDIVNYVGRTQVSLVVSASVGTVVGQLVNAANDGTFITQPALPGTTHIDSTHEWTNTTGMDVNARIEVLPGSKYVKSSQPNLVFLRHRTTYAVGIAPTAETPDIADVFDSEFGGGFDRITAEGDVPAQGVMERAQATMPQALDDFIIQAGEKVQIRYRIVHFAPSPWSETANANLADYNVAATNVLVQLWVCAAGV